MRLLKRALYLHALVWALLGATLAVWPRVLERLGQPSYVEGVWVRLFGLEAVGLALLMVLVGHRAEELWWWSWAFAFTSGAAAAALTLNAGFGVPEGGGAALWWVLAGVAWALASAILLGLQRAATERPPHAHPPAPARDPHPRRRSR